MSSFHTHSLVKVVEGNLLESKAQTLVNTVNCVGVMGKGIALDFKRRYPYMFQDYVRRCDRGLVKLGQPYAYQAEDRLIVNFPTKDHWRAVSRLEDIVDGLDYLKKNFRRWGITSIAVPPLGCGNGQLEWDVVGPTLYRHLSELKIPVELYAPHGVRPEQKEIDFLEHGEPSERSRFVEPAWVALAAVLKALEDKPYHWPVGRVMFQKIAYFATQAGIKTGLEYERASYGPYSATLKQTLARLQNNGIVTEVRRGNLFEVRAGSTFNDAHQTFGGDIDKWAPAIARVVDLVERFDTKNAEVASSVHLVSSELANKLGRVPYASEVLHEVEQWKIRRSPALTRDEILEAMVVLGRHGWIEIEADEPLIEYVDQFEYA